jgi:PAS domain S-box-containing protein
LGFDISEQKRAAVELERYGKIFRYISDMVIVAGRDGLLKDVNPAFARTLGYAEDELNARPLLEFIHPDDHQTTLDELKRQIGGKFDTLNFENRYLCKDGSPRWFSWNAYFEEKEQLFFGIARDITESKKSLEELAFVNECFAQALGGSQHILYRLNVKKGCYDYMSPAFERITGHKVEAFRNNGLDQLKTFFHPDDLDSVFSLIDDRLRTRTGKTVTFEFEYRFRKADGGYCWLHDSNTACFNDNDELECFFGSAHDVTARMEAQAALQGAHDELEVRVSERTRDLMVVTEKLKEMSFELIRAEEKERARIAAELHDEVGQSLLLAKMKMDMLASELNDALQSKLAGEASLLLERSLHDVRNLTFEMRPPLLDSAGIVAALERLGTTLRVDFGLAVDIRCSSEKLPLDREKSYSLFQTLRELLLNVAKHARTDRAELLITVKPAFVSIEVNDNGIGFEYGDRFKLRADDWGFGLFNVQQRIGQMGGEVVIVSTPGRGTSVTLSIPVAER